DIAAQTMNEMIAANRESVAVAGHYPHVEVGPSHLEPGCNRRRPPMNRMETIRIHVVRKAAGASDAGDENDFLAGDAEFRHDFLDLRQDCVIAASWTPADFLV